MNINLDYRVTRRSKKLMAKWARVGQFSDSKNIYRIFSINAILGRYISSFKIKHTLGFKLDLQYNCKNCVALMGHSLADS